ncbi:phenylacetate--CoA ligase family protein [Winogradskyella aquimaris]|uniref:CoF synthetase n=1 Tax=Winogradskyella aquimaris TaxID=864074 RepID=A0ABU5EM00_9FLAO|nr:CoF synthetase [Winogradskyella aquimaris]MDY2587104.1 CoF synthetase [Winogradskyella aquimaris]
MSYLNRLRYTSFWALDALKGGPVRKNLKDVKTILENPFDDKSRYIRERYLDRLLSHAYQTTPFYKAQKKSHNIEQFPVIDKNTIIQNFSLFQSQNYLNLKNYEVSTSGSTGVPFNVFHNKHKRLRNTADVLYFSNLTGYLVGDSLLFLESWRLMPKANAISSFLKNIDYIDVSKFNIGQVNTLIGKLYKGNTSKVLVGLPSAFETIREYFRNNHINKEKLFNIKSIITVSEYLDKNLKHWLEDFFETNVVSRYSNEEMGILAQQGINTQEDLFDFNWASYHLEILKFDCDEPAEHGEIGRIVITDLFNYCMPLIRYDTGDVGAFDNTKHYKNYKLKKIYGRKMDQVYDTKGAIVSPHLIHTIFYPFFKNIRQYQFVQTGKKDFLIKLNVYDKFQKEDELIQIVKSQFGQNSNIKIKYVNEIPLLASGKRKKVMNTYK